MHMNVRKDDDGYSIQYLNSWSDVYEVDEKFRPDGLTAILARICSYYIYFDEIDSQTDFVS